MRKPALPIPGVPINITEKRETILTSFNQAFESPLHDDQPILPQGRQAKGGNTKDKRDLSKGWQRTTTFQEQATIFKKVKQKEEEPASPKHFLFIQGSPITQVALNRWYKNERSPRNTHLDITTPKRNISLETS